MSDYSVVLCDIIKQMIRNESSIVDEEIMLPFEKNNSYIEISFVNVEDESFTVKWEYNISSISGDSDEVCYENIEDACSCAIQVFRAWYSGVSKLWAMDGEMEIRLMNLISGYD